MHTAFYRNPHLLLLTIAVLVVGGLSALISLPRLEDPELNNRAAIVLTALPGATAERVEALVTEKLEDAIREIDEVNHVNSRSQPGVSFVTIELQETVTNTTQVWSEIRDKVADATALLPPEASKPFFDDTRGAEAFGVILALSWNLDRAPEYGVMSRLADELGDRLRNLPGTEVVRIYGEAEEELRVTVDSSELADLGLSVADVAARVRASDAKVAAGAVRSNGSDALVEVAGEIDSAARVASIPLAVGPSGELVRLDAVAEVRRARQEPPSELGSIDGRSAIFVAARVQNGRQLDQWTVLAHEAVADFEQNIDDGVGIVWLFEQSEYTVDRLVGLGINLLLGGLIILAVILVMMGWKSAILVGSALPLTTAAVLLGLNILGVPLHQMSITGLIIALGLLIDNAIVTVDEVRSRLAQGTSAAEAIGGTVRHLLVPLFGSTLTTVLAFMPILLLEGSVGEFVGTIALSVILALISSFVLAMTVIVTLTGRMGIAAREERTWWRTGIEAPRAGEWFRGFLDTVLARPLFGIGLTAALPLLGFFAAPLLKQQFFPPADRNQFYVQIWLPSETAITTTAARTREIEAVVRQEPGIEHIAWLAGGSAPTFYYNMLMNQDGESSYAQALVEARDYRTVQDVTPRLQTRLDEAFPDAQIVVRLLGQGPPVDAPIEVRLTGPSLATLRELGDEVRQRLIAMPEVVHTRATMAAGEPQFALEADEEEVRLAGLTLAGVASQLDGRLDGAVGGSLIEQTQELPVRIRLANGERASPEQVGSMPIAVPGGREWVPLDALGQLRLEPELRAIAHRDGERINTIKGYLTVDALPPGVTARFAASLEEDGFALPPGYRLEFGGDSEERGEATAGLLKYVPVLTVLMVAAIVLSFRSFQLAGVLGVVAVFSVGLGLLTVFVSGYPFGFMAMIGTAGLIGVAINDSIVVLAAIRANPSAAAGDAEAIKETVVENARHVLATTFTTTGGFLPLIISGGDFWGPMAVVIAGGVTGATAIALVFIPSAYRWLHRERTDEAAVVLEPVEVEA